MWSTTTQTVIPPRRLFTRLSGISPIASSREGYWSLVETIRVAARLLSEIAGGGRRVVSYGLGQTRQDYFAQDIRVDAAGGLTFGVSSPMAE